MKKLNKPVLAEGEVTGHSHRLQDDNAVVYELENGNREFVLDRPTNLIHEEHKPINLPDSIVFNSGIVNEYDPFDEEVRKVVD